MAFLHLTGSQLMNAVGYVEGVAACLVMMAQPGNPARRWGLFAVFNTLIIFFSLTNINRIECTVFDLQRRKHNMETL